ncbi:cobyrinate a,c-diamide synthase [Limnochorda pilosa]|uniref:Cobyrinate a,c-diamide synthase n=1 Tax=Limnochorda pilosa TaxID=1555112 RepID=A0A0K2SQF0_LIMPI|nr:cobyrinate a,c-diamide synthase [Limnochorda pilosa]BAS29326.1 cobyrinic acid a,c-diamide synthase [Limnochorda pilosa]
MTARLVVAGTHSGVGKTTVAVGLMAALARRGLAVQGFKVGPDFIDPSYHRAATGRPVWNLDTWMAGEAGVRRAFDRATFGASVAVVEGVMGLYDGAGPTDDRGSTAAVARLLDAPVLLVLDGSALARSAAAVVRGFQTFAPGGHPGLHLAGVVANRVAGAGHLRLLREAIEAYTGVPLLGGLAREEALRLPERHLGLVPAPERPATGTFLELLAGRVEAGLDVDRILALARSAPPLCPWDEPVEERLCREEPPRGVPRRPSHPTGPAPQPQVRIALARDEAFSFYYEENLDRLQEAGAELLPFSPMRDDALPGGCGAVYLGGGYPELFARELAGNRSMRASLQHAASRGMPILAECGGLLYLCRELVDFQGRRYPMVGLVRGTARMQERLAALGYVEVEGTGSSFLLEPGEVARGHVFHHSVFEPEGTLLPPYRIRNRRDPGAAGHAVGNLLASYVHLHFASNPRLAPRLVEAARRFLAGSQARAPAGRYRRETDGGKRTSWGGASGA